MTAVRPALASDAAGPSLAAQVRRVPLIGRGLVTATNDCTHVSVQEEASNCMGGRHFSEDEVLRLAMQAYTNGEASFPIVAIRVRLSPRYSVNSQG